MTNRIGQQLGNYRLVHLLGQGDFSEVYLGEHVYQRMQVAIKLLHTQLGGNEVESFRMEAQRLASLRHPQILSVLDCGLEGTMPFLVMGYVPTGNLRQRYAKGMRVQLPMVVTYVKQVAEALQYAIEQRLLHRDIKPENMLVGQRDEVLLSDFGIGAIFNNTIAMNMPMAVSSIPYMAPEQIQRHPSPASDQYSLGVVVYEWLSGELPFHGSVNEILNMHMMAPPPSLRAMVPGLSAEVEQVVMKALAKDPRGRFPSVQAFAMALEQVSQVATSSPVAARQGSRFPEAMNRPGSAGPSDEFMTRPGQPLSQTALATPANPFQLKEGAMPANQATMASNSMASSAQPAIAPPDTLSPQEPPKRGISRRTMVLGLAGLGIAGLALVGGAVEAVNLLSSSSPVAPPKPTFPFSWSGFGYDAAHTHFNPDEHVLSATNVSRLALAWSAPTKGAIFSSSPAAANGLIFVGSQDKKLYAFDATTGKVKWSAPTGNVIFSSPAIADGLIFISCNDKKLYAFDAASGQMRWSTSTGAAIFSSPVLVNSIVYAGSQDKKLYAFNATSGQILWSAPTGNAIYDSPAVANGVVYVGSHDKNLYAFDATTGKKLWSTATGDIIYSSPAVANGLVYVGSADHKLHAFNATTGKSSWSTSTGAPIYSSPAVANGVVYAGSYDKKLYAFDAMSGQVKWSSPTQAPIFSSPAVANGIVFAGSQDKKLYAFDATSGQVLWFVSPGNLINSSPAVANGYVYVGCDDGKLYAFRLNTTGA
jgi:outer membrane protein assembly factor BamB